VQFSVPILLRCFVVVVGCVVVLCFLGPHLRHMEVPRLEVKWELQLPACATATAMQDLSCVCGLHHSSRQHRILDPPSKARDQTRILMDPGRVGVTLSHEGNSHIIVLILIYTRQTCWTLLVHLKSLLDFLPYTYFQSVPQDSEEACPYIQYSLILLFWFFSHIAPLFSQLQNALYLNITSFPLAGTHGHFSHSVNAPQSCNSF